MIVNKVKTTLRDEITEVNVGPCFQPWPPLLQRDLPSQAERAQPLLKTGNEVAEKNYKNVKKLWLLFLHCCQSLYGILYRKCLLNFSRQFQAVLQANFNRFHAEIVTPLSTSFYRKAQMLRDLMWNVWSWNVLIYTWCLRAAVNVTLFTLRSWTEI